MRKVGLLGGSFNPAHAGHIYISAYAKKALGLDEIWWLVSPANPFKDFNELASYDIRVKHAVALVKPPFIRVSDVEGRRGFRYSYDSVKYLRKANPDIEFVWIIGADNFSALHHWYRAEMLAKLIPIAVMNRGEGRDLHKIIRSKFAMKYERNRVQSTALVSAGSPSWTYVVMRKNAQSATNLRKTLGSEAFLLHNDKNN